MNDANTGAGRRSRGALLAHAGHELRTPLNAIIGFADLMFRGKVGPVSPEHKEYLGDILDSSRQLLRLIGELLDIAKLDSGNMQFRAESVDPRRVVAEVRGELGALAASKHIHVDTEVDPAIAAVVLDPSKLKQVLHGFLSNALKFTPEDGHVTIRVVPEPLDRFRIEVEDTGIGIRVEDVPRLFVEFEQLDARTTKEHPGAGLGLALNRRIAEAQGGHVGARSAPGKGSTFWAVLPTGHPGGLRDGA